MMVDSRSPLSDQLREAQKLCNEHGLHDAAQYIDRYVMHDPPSRVGIWLRDQVVKVTRRRDRNAG